MEAIELTIPKGDCIYGLWCDQTQKVYVGFSANVPKRMREHRCLLKSGKHSEPELQRDYNTYGEKSFRVATLAILNKDAPVSERRAEELKWMDEFSKDGRLYNTKRISFQPPVGAPAKAAATRQANGYRPSEESNLKRRLAQLGKPKNHGHKISATKRAKQVMR